jgi:hypothetical protein
MSESRAWEQRVAAWRSSGLSAARFCAGRDFTETALRYWARRLGPLGPTRGPGPSEPAPAIRLARVERAAFPGRASERPSPAPKPTSAAPVVGGRGVVLAVGELRIAIEPGFDRATLAAVLEVVAAGQRATA